MSIFVTHYCVYYNPPDYPGKFVLRRWFIVGSGSPKPNQLPDMIEDNYAPIETHLQRLGLHRLERFQNDDPCIKEVWL